MGVFITVEGIDGAGKTTQVQMLAKYLRDKGYTVATFRDPGDTELGGKLRELLLHSDGVEIGTRAETLLYMAARAQLVEEKLKPAKLSHDFVISDRYLLSNMAYQGAGGGLGMYPVQEVGFFAVNQLLPDLTILLDVAPAVALGRLTAGADRIERRGLAYFTAIADGFTRWANNAGATGERTKYATFAASTIEAVHASIAQHVSDHYLKEVAHVPNG